MAITICFLITPLSTLHQPDHSIWTHDTHMEMCTLPQMASNSSYIRHATSSSGHMKDSAVGWYKKMFQYYPAKWSTPLARRKGAECFLVRREWKHGHEIWEIASKICPINNSMSTMKRFNVYRKVSLSAWAIFLQLHVIIIIAVKNDVLLLVLNRQCIVEDMLHYRSYWRCYEQPRLTANWESFDYVLIEISKVNLS